jgi:hypothetical protein
VTPAPESTPTDIFRREHHHGGRRGPKEIPGPAQPNQSSVLNGMLEKAPTVSRSSNLPSPFFVLATQT